MLRLMFDVNRPGNRLEQVPRCTYDFITILNNTRFDFTLYRGNSTQVVDIIGNCPAYTILTFPHEKLADTVNFVWAGGGGGVETVASERCKVFFTAENMGLVGQFRAPELAPVPLLELPGARLFGGVATVGNVLVCTNKIIIRAIYLSNLNSTASMITIRHVGAAGTNNIATDLPIGVGVSHAFGLLILQAGDTIHIPSIVGNVSVGIYGEGR